MILLDTSVVYWSVTGDRRLGRAARRVLEHSAVRYVSAITHVELAIKEMNGKLRLPEDIGSHLRRIGLEGLPFTESHAEGMRALTALITHDPFDRMLLAQARVEGVPLLTSDSRLLRHPGTIDATE